MHIYCNFEHPPGFVVQAYWLGVLLESLGIWQVDPVLGAGAHVHQALWYLVNTELFSSNEQPFLVEEAGLLQEARISGGSPPWLAHNP